MSGGPEPFQYAVLRIVPQVERGECFNAGVLLFCRTRSFLSAAIALDERRLAALAPGVPAAAIQRHLDGLGRVAAGAPSAGPIAAMTQSERFGWLVGPSSTVVQASPVHTGLSDDPAATLEHLLRRLVLP